MTATLPGLVRRRAKDAPDGLAVVEIRATGARTVTWRDLDEQSARVAAHLETMDVRAGEHVGFQLPNWLDFVVLALGVLRLGAVCCPLMPIFRTRELVAMLRRARARVVFAPDEFRGRRQLQALLPEIPTLQRVVRVPLENLPAREPATPWPLPDAIAQLLFTSGTSGEPKGVLHRNEVLMRAAQMEIAHLGLNGADRIFIPSPLAHQTGFLYGMWLAIVLGVTQIVQERWNPRLALDALNAWGGTFVQAATPFLADLVDLVERTHESPRTLRIFVPTGATVPRPLAQKAAGVLGAAICGAFGTTEGCLATLAAPSDPLERARGTDGRPLDGIRIRVTDDAGIALPACTEGNYEILSPTMFVGYLDDPAATAAAHTPDGWYRTGDLAIIDADGYLRITGRVKDVINRGGEKIPVAEIEQLLYAHGAVREAAIVAMPDERLGERACAFIVLVDGAQLDFAAMQEYLEGAGVAKQYWPERLELLDALPKTASGKIQKYVLRERAKGLRPMLRTNV
jgi:cyclohexanecarboxylate-CoA ligase